MRIADEVRGTIAGWVRAVYTLSESVPTAGGSARQLVCANVPERGNRRSIMNKSIARLTIGLACFGASCAGASANAERVAQGVNRFSAELFTKLNEAE